MKLIIGAFTGLLAAVLAIEGALGCATVSPKGGRVEIATEEAVIVWDARKKLQHFIRRASFVTRAKHFGFLVPTPTMPVLDTASDEIFKRLGMLLTPPVQTRYGRSFRISAFCLAPFSSVGSSAPDATARVTDEVELLHTQRVAGFDAAVLQADSTEVLSRWLARHGYPSSPELERWLAPYVEQRWKITAFKVARNARAGETPRVGSQAVRMSFKTDRPFFPYREPQRPAGDGDAQPRRMLRVYVVSDARMAGKIGKSGEWPGQLKYADKTGSIRRLLAGAMDAKALPETAWITAFEDTASPRPGTDELFFTPAPDQAAVRPAPIIVDKRQHIWIPLELILLLLFGVGWIWRRLRRRS